ncbi:MAG TPA: TIGR02530 family flagellar biosynthesis protein [Bdellovibrionales bacterium]|jgi:flagellar operon protein|nr:TIGR02530 family flagellar biosynthesis protein [Bdellovibrionales bacterium]
MALDKLTGGAAGLSTIKPVDGSNKPANGMGAGAESAEFRRTLDQVAQGLGTKPSTGAQAIGQIGQAQGAAAAGALKFSNHAIERMHSRGISFAPDQMKSIESAIQKAAAKGSKDTLVLAGDNALIVSVKNKTVVTVMDRAGMKDNVFTNIDSTVVV